MAAGRDTPRRDADRSRSLWWWLVAGAASVAATAVLVKLAVDVVPQPWDGVAGMAAFLPVIVPTRYLRLRAREG